jgi:hypothetical protein
VTEQEIHRLNRFDGELQVCEWSNALAMSAIRGPSGTFKHATSDGSVVSTEPSALLDEIPSIPATLAGEFA